SRLSRQEEPSANRMLPGLNKRGAKQEFWMSKGAQFFTKDLGRKTTQLRRNKWNIMVKQARVCTGRVQARIEHRKRNKKEKKKKKREGGEGKKKKKRRRERIGKEGRKKGKKEKKKKKKEKKKERRKGKEGRKKKRKRKKRKKKERKREREKEGGKRKKEKKGKKKGEKGEKREELWQAIQLGLGLTRSRTRLSPKGDSKVAAKTPHESAPRRTQPPLGNSKRIYPL
ncbi:hypothetical protein XELAEV_18006814mg, partial [Xenopus laevis]